MPKHDHTQPELHCARIEVADVENDTPRAISETTTAHRAAALISAVAQLIAALAGVATLLLYRS
ncbi:hypothetical protein [Streptomyces spinoverrucosus]|uniref:hypothetical protein n=1 Tax=Streptomyces spinoverrucosus TaxID=284043 RepID=UPI0011447EE8|nr:hypothetical protein [Streptomyces spinoverrucosus]